MRVENFGTTAPAQTDPKVKAKEQGLQAQMEALLSTYPVTKTNPPNQLDDLAVNPSQGAQNGEG